MLQKAVERVVPVKAHREIEGGGVGSFVLVVAASPSDMMVDNRGHFIRHYLSYLGHHIYRN